MTDWKQLATILIRRAGGKVTITPHDLVHMHREIQILEIHEPAARGVTFQIYDPHAPLIVDAEIVQEPEDLVRLDCPIKLLGGPVPKEFKP